METWLVVFLGVIALGSLIQVAFLISVAVFAMRTAKRAAELRRQAESELRVPLAHLKECAREAREISMLVAGEVRALRDSAHTAIEEVRTAKQDVQRVARTPLVEVTAFAKGVARAFSAFRRAPRRSAVPATIEASYVPPPAAGSDWSAARPRA